MSDNTARVLLLAGFLLIGPFGAYHRIKAHTGERIDRRQEGWLILLTLRPLALAMAVGIFAFIFNPASMAWSSLPLPSWLRWSGVGFACAGAALILWTYRTLGHNLTDTVVTRQNAALVTTGPYRWIRHPFYVSLLLLVIADALVAANWFIGITGLGLFTLLAIRSNVEERNLVARFGTDYEAYRQRTGRFFPRL